MKRLYRIVKFSNGKKIYITGPNDSITLTKLLTQLKNSQHEKYTMEEYEDPKNKQQVNS